MTVLSICLIVLFVALQWALEPKVKIPPRIEWRESPIPKVRGMNHG